MNNNQKVEIVTGSSSGIGLETAIHLAKNGFKTYATIMNIGKSNEINERSSYKQNCFLGY